ncbi:MAG: HNH endonuclease [Chloroflexi bacterium]|nr:HNH endonuclease [Chloroflexota bacterium]
MVPRRQISEEIQQKVRQRATFLCEYCHTSEKWQYVPFTVDHIIPVSESGSDTFDNLALACFHCNRRKSNHTFAIDSKTGNQVALFNPREQQWGEHFMWSPDKLYIMGETAVGRATIELLQLNRARIIPIRAADLAINRHPPLNDPIKGKL